MNPEVRLSQRTLTAAAAALLILSATPDSARAQIRGSEAAVTTQTIDGTTLTLAYSRPSARGRDLFGGVVPWNVVWTPGANWATTLDVNRPVRLNGADVPTGKYTVWMTPRANASWTLSLNPNAKLFHFQKPDSTADQIHIAVEPEEGPHREMLTWSFPAVSGDGGLLTLAWGSTVVPLEVVVQPTKPVAMTAGERARFVGAYDMSFVPIPNWEAEGRLEVVEKEGRLRARLPFSIHPGDELEFDFVPAGTDRFSAGLYRDGTLFNVEPAFTFEFDVDEENGVATVVRVRGVEGSVFGEGGRTVGAQD